MNDIHLSPLTESEYAQIVYPLIIKIFADGLYKSRETPTSHDATKEATIYFYTLIKKGINTPDHFFYSIKDNNARVGFIWFYLKSVKSKTISRLALIYIKEGFRRKGMAECAINLIEKKLAQKNISTVELNVFSKNDAALNLYDKLGYKKNITHSTDTRFLMIKKIL